MNTLLLYSNHGDLPLLWMPCPHHKNSSLFKGIEGPSATSIHCSGPGLRFPKRAVTGLSELHLDFGGYQGKEPQRGENKRMGIKWEGVMTPSSAEESRAGWGRPSVSLGMR